MQRTSLLTLARRFHSRLFFSILWMGMIALSLGAPQPALSLDLFVGDHDNNSVLRIDSETGAISTFVSASSGGLKTVTGVNFGPDGQLYVSSRDTNQVLRYDGVTGAFMGVFASVHADRIFDARYGPDGNLYVAHDLRGVQRYNGLTGAFMDDFVAPGSIAGYPRGLTFGPDGSLYVASDGGGIYRYGSSGAFLGVFASGPGAHMLVFGPDGNLFVACPFASQVVRYDGITGASLGAFVPPGSGGLNYAIGLAFGPDGNLFVSSARSNRILRYNGLTGAFMDVFATNVSDGDLRLGWMTFGPNASPPEPAPVPEPSSLLTLGGGVIGSLGYLLRRRVAS